MLYTKSKKDNKPYKSAWGWIQSQNLSKWKGSTIFSTSKENINTLVPRDQGIYWPHVSSPNVLQKSTLWPKQ